MNDRGNYSAGHLPLELSGRHVIVFGGTTGINFGIAKAFAQCGATVGVVSRQADNVNRAVRELQQTGATTYGAIADVRDFELVGRVFEEAAADYGLVDVLISGAAGNFLCEGKNLSANGFKAVVDIDLIGTFHVMRHGHAYLRKPGASVINISAPQASVPMRFQVHCAAAKAGVDQMTRVLALEWGVDGITVNAIVPGPIDGTEGVQRLLGRNEKERARAATNVPICRLGTLEDVANLALFLASPYASFVSGAVIPCDGGGAIDSVRVALQDAGYAAREAESALR